MITLKIQNDSSKPHIAVIGGLHGNELLGKNLFHAIAQRATEFANLTVVVANLAAYHKDTRFIDQDLNRSFPGSKAGNHEEKLAAEIMEIIHDASYVIDVHTTTSPGFDRAAISGELTNAKRKIVKLFDLKQVAIMEPKLLSKSLIGNSAEGVSVEYGIETAADPALVNSMIDAILKLQDPASEDMPFEIEQYDVLGTIDKSKYSELELQNFTFSEEIGGYPFIVDEKHYVDTRGFLLGHKKAVSI